MKKLFLFFVSVFCLCGLIGCGGGSSSTKTTYEVKFYEDSNCRTQFGQTVTVEDGSKVARPTTTPTKAEDDEFSYTFSTWIDYDSEEEFNFDTPIKKNYKLYAEYTRTAKTYDLYVFIWQGDTNNTYITDLEANALKTNLESMGTAANKRVLVTTRSGISMNAFATEVNETDYVDVVIAGANINPADPGDKVVIDKIGKAASDEEGKQAKIANGWFINQTRYVGICYGAENTHFTLAKQVYDTLLETGPYVATLDKTSLGLEVGQSDSISVTTNCTYSFSSENDEIATVTSEGLVTAVSEGSTTINILVGNALVYPVAVTVVEEISNYSITVMMFSRVYDNLLTLQAEYAKVADSRCTVIWLTGSQTSGNEKVAQFSADVYAYDQDETKADVDLVIAHTQVTSGHENGLAGATYGYVFSNRTSMNSTWSTKGDTNYYAATRNSVEGFAEVECLKIINILSQENPDYFTVSPTSISLIAGGTTTIEASTTVSYSSSDATVATVDDSGLVTAVSEGEANITVTKGLKTIIIPVIVTADTTPKYDLLVWVNRTNDSNPEKWMSNEDFEILQEFLEALGEKVEIVNRQDSKVADLKTNVEAQPLTERVDIVIGREAFKKLYEGTDTAVYNVDASWGFNTGYAVVVGSEETHSDLVNAVLAFLQLNREACIYGEDYFTLESYSATLNVGGTVAIVPSATGVAYASNDETVATVSNEGLVTAIGIGQTAISVTKGNYTAEFAVDVVENDSYTITVMMYQQVYDNIEALQAAYDEVKDPNCNVIWLTSTATKVANFSADVYAYDQDETKANVDLVIGHTQVTSGHENGLAGPTYNYVFANRTSVDSSWTSNAATNYYAATRDSVRGVAETECLKIITILSTAQPAA